MYLSLVQAALVYRHQGMIREALFSMGQALKTVEAVGATPLIAQALSLFGDLKIRAGEMDEGAEMLEKATELRAEIEKSKEIVNLDCCVGYYHGKNKLWEEELEAYEHAEMKLEALMSPGFIRNMDMLQTAGEVDDPSEDYEVEQKEEPRRRGRAPKKATAADRGRSKSTTSKSAPAVPAKSAKTVMTECSSLQKMRGHILRSKAYNLAVQSQCSLAEALLKEASSLPCGHHEFIHQRLAAAKHLLLESLSLLASDSAFSCLQDSTISIPSVAPQKPPTTTPAQSKRAAKEFESQVKLVGILTRARDSVAEIHYLSAKVGSTIMVHNVSMLLSGIIVLLSAVTSSASAPKISDISRSIDPLFASYSLELNKCLPLLREADAIEAEKATAGSEPLSWPVIVPHHPTASNPRAPEADVGGSSSRASTPTIGGVSIPFEFSSFQKDYIDILPPSWTVVSLSLSDSLDEMYISRYQSHQQQFLLRLPLARQASGDTTSDLSFDNDSDVPDAANPGAFTYANGMAELRTIMTLANASAQSAKEATSSGGKSEKAAEWWREREALDARFAELLANVEHCWLGGFRGIFGQYTRHKEGLRKFADALDGILGAHLMSRRVKGRRKKGGQAPGEEGRVRLDRRVVELFIGLGDPAATRAGVRVTGGKNEGDGEEDVSEPVRDLLWFLFDILQFGGEKNAWDELDVEEASHHPSPEIVSGMLTAR